MTDALHVDVVAADRRVWEGEALSIVARTSEGDVGILPGHEPFLAVLVPCMVEILTDGGTREIVVVDGGFLSVADNRVAVLSPYGRLAKEISLTEAEGELRAAEKRLEAGEIDLETRQHHQRATAQLRAAQKAHQNH